MQGSELWNGELPFSLTYLARFPLYHKNIHFWENIIWENVAITFVWEKWGTNFPWGVRYNLVETITFHTGWSSKLKKRILTCFVLQWSLRLKRYHEKWLSFASISHHFLNDCCNPMILRHHQFPAQVVMGMQLCREKAKGVNAPRWLKFILWTSIIMKWWHFLKIWRICHPFFS